MPRAYPRHAERIGPVGEQMYHAAAREAERDRRARITPEPMPGQRDPRDTPMRERAMRDPQPMRAPLPRDLELVRRGRAHDGQNARPRTVRSAPLTPASAAGMMGAANPVA